MTKRKPKRDRVKPVDVHDCAKGHMHDAYALRVVKTMPGGFIA